VTSSDSRQGVSGRIFVVGAPRSGTTLVQSLLAAHSATNSFTESHFFDRHFTRLPLLGSPVLTRNPGPRLREFLEENGEAHTEAARHIEERERWLLRARPLLPLQTRWVGRQLLRVFDELTLRRGSSCWIEKTPRHLHYLSFLESLSLSDSPMRFVHVLRDGLEVVASLHEASKSWERAYDLETCVHRWNTDLSLSLSRLRAPTDHFVFYEELTEEPEATLQRLLVELGLDWEPGILEGYGSASQGLITGTEKAWKADVGRGIRRSGTADRLLTGEQRHAVTRSLRRGLYDEVRDHVRH